MLKYFAYACEYTIAYTAVGYVKLHDLCASEGNRIQMDTQHDCLIGESVDQPSEDQSHSITRD